MKSAVVAVGVVVAVCAAYVGTAVVSGQKVEKSLRAMSTGAQAQWPMIRVTDEHYERGLFSATHTFTLRPACDAPEAGASAPPAAITLVQHVKLGPFPGFNRFGAATVDTELALDAASRKQASELFGAAPPFHAHTDVAFGGATHTQFSIGSFHVTGPKAEQVDFQGLTGDIDNSDRATEFDVRMPALSVADAASAPAAVHMAIKGLHLHARGEGTGELALRPGKSQGEVQSIDVAVTGPDDAAHKANFSQLRFSQDTAIAGNLLSATAHADGMGQVDDTKVDRIEMAFGFKRFDALTYQRIVQRFMNSDAQSCGKKAPDPATLFASPDVQAAFVKMLASNPEVSLDKLLVVVDGRSAELGYAIGVAGFTADDARLPLKASLMTRGYGNVRVKLPEEWVQKAMTTIAQQSGKTSGAHDQAALADVMLTKVIDQGFVVREEGMLRTEAAFRSGRVTVNGKPLGGPPAAPAPAAM